MKLINVQGTAVPALGFGTWQIQGEACYEAVSDALSIGYRHIDTAQIYGNEVEVGRALGASGVARDEIFLTTKIWNDKVTREEILGAAGESLERLGVEYVDLMLVHWPIAEQRSIEETVDAFVAIKEAGQARAIGVSNFVPSHVERALSRAKIFANQVEYHPLLAQTELLELARANDFMLTAYSPLARFSSELFGGTTIDAIAQAHGKSPAQVVLRWFMEQDLVSAIPKASSHEHRKQNFEIFDFELTPDEVETISALDQQKRMIKPPHSPAEWG